LLFYLEYTNNDDRLSYGRFQPLVKLLGFVFFEFLRAFGYSLLNNTVSKFTFAYINPYENEKTFLLEIFLSRRKALSLNLNQLI